jgi:hypothetical protein
MLLGSWIAVGPKPPRPPVHGAIQPKYVVLTVIYAPPGTNGGKSTSSVVYSAGSTTGTTTSASQTFKQSYSISLEGSGGFLGNGGGAGLSFEYAKSATDNQSLEIKKSSATTIERTGPAQDGINHDEDQIWLWLNPKIDLALTPSSAAWTFNRTDTAVLQYVNVGDLKDPAHMPPGVMNLLNKYGIIAADFPEILRRDPFAEPSYNPDRQRYQPLNFTFPYEPPYSATDPVPTTTYNLSNSSTSTTGATAEDDYKIGLTISATGDFLDLAKATIKNVDTWEWTNRSSKLTTNGTTESASVKVGGPAFGYAGSTLMEVYFDSVYKTFAFRVVPLDKPLALEGTLLDASGKPLVGSEVSLIADGIVYRTVTDSKGGYRFYGNMSGPLTLQSNGVTQMIPQQPVRRGDYRVPANH